jgi:periplasmic protein TonB
MSTRAAAALDEHPHWLVRGVLLAGVVILVVSVRVLMGSHSLRDSELPQRVALVDAEPPPIPAPLAEPQSRQPPPEDQERGDGLDVEVAATDAGLGPTDTQLAVDADAEAGFDSFGLGAKRGGRDLALDLGKPERAGGAGGSAGFTHYASDLGSYLNSWLNADDDLRRLRYVLHARIWLDPDGGVQHCVLLGTSGDADVDRKIGIRLSAARLPNGPPSDLPQPISLLIRSSISGN